MINLSVQFISLVVSFLYGMFFYILLEINYKFLTFSYIIIKILLSFIFVLFNTLLYFIILLYINKGYVHIYFLFCILCGYLFCKVLYKLIVNKIRIWYTMNKDSR